jgi:hypothetical protein
MNGKGQLVYWIIAAMFTVMLGMTGYIASGINAQINSEIDRLNRANNRIVRLCERMALIEFQLNMKANSCTPE